jgi:hypothetical protein
MGEWCNWRSGAPLAGGIHATCEPAGGTGQSWFRSDGAVAERVAGAVAGAAAERADENWRDKSALRKSVGAKMFHNGGAGAPRERRAEEAAARLFAGSGLKHCPGDTCKIWLPACQFANNCNMADGMDTYCLECNKRKRDQRGSRREQLKGRRLDPAVDEFEAFQERRRDAVGPKFDLERRALTKIGFAVEHFLGAGAPIGADKIFSKLFSGRRPLCDFTGLPLSAGCFVDHHEIHFEREGARLNVQCSGATMPLR